MTIERVNSYLPSVNKIESLNEMILEINGRNEQGSFDLNELDQMFADLAIDRKFIRNYELGNTVSTYTGWSNIHSESGYDIWKYTVPNYAYNSLNKLYLDDKVLDFRGVGTSEIAQTFDLVYLYDATLTTYNNYTSEAGTEAGTQFSLMNEDDDYLYIGDAATFGGVKIEFYTRGSNYTLKVEYFNGAWTELTLNANDLVDNTSSFSSDGYVAWTSPVDWITNAVNAQTNYWIRISTTTAPVTVAESYYAIPYNSVISLLAMSSEQLFNEKWSWCSYGTSIYVTIRNTGATIYEGDYYITSSSSATNKQNFFIYNHEYKIDCEDSTYIPGLDIFTLDNLSDVDVSSGLIDGQSLRWDSAAGLWRNTTPAEGVTNHALLSNLAYATSGHTGFQSTLSSSAGLSTAIGGDVAVVDGGTGKSSWTQYLLVYADTITSLSQIPIGTSGQVLTSNGAGSAPTFQAPTGGGGTGATALDELTDVMVSSSLEDGQTLSWDSGDAMWRNRAGLYLSEIGYVGMGEATTPEYPLEIIKTVIGTTSSTTKILNIEGTYVCNYGGNYFIGCQENYWANPGTGNAEQVIASWTTMNNNSGSTVTEIVGLNFSSYNYGTASSMKAGIFDCGQVSGTTLANAYSVYTSAYMSQVSSVITNYYSIYCSEVTKMFGIQGTIVNNYGLYIPNRTEGSTLNFAIYTNTGLVRFGDNIISAGNYLNFGSVSGSSGYGIRNNGGTIQWRNASGVWADLGTEGAGFTLDSLLDVDIVSPLADGEVLAWDTATALWKNSTPVFNATLDDLSNVMVSSGLVDGQVLIWDSADVMWRNSSDIQIAGKMNIGADMPTMYLTSTSLDVNKTVTSHAIDLNNSIVGVYGTFQSSHSNNSFIGLNTYVTNLSSSEIPTNFAGQWTYLSNEGTIAQCDVFSASSDNFGTIDIMAGGRFDSGHSGNTVMNKSYGIITTYWMSGVSSVCNDYCGFYPTDPTKLFGTQGTVLRNYGIYIADRLAGNDNWAIYTNLGLVHFGDDLEVVGDIRANGFAIDEDPATHTSTGLKTTFTAAEALTFGDVCFINSSGKAQLIDADAIATMSGICMCVDLTISQNVSGNFLLVGIVGDNSWNWTVGGLIYGSLQVSANDILTQTPPSGTNDVVQIMGVATAINRMYFNPNLSQVEHT